jgi:hypothetical protein
LVRHCLLSATISGFDMKKISCLYFLILLALLISGCRESYEPPVLTIDYSFLVVEGIINTSPGAETVIVLSRSKKLTDTTTFVPEKGAVITIESQSGSQYALTEIGDGMYVSGSLNLNNAVQYKLNITTADQAQYRSDYTASLVAPPIDSLEWEQDEDVTIFVNTHDPNNKTHYYQWEYVETWQYNSELETTWSVNNGLIYGLSPFEQIHTCWIDSNSTNIIVGSSIRLSEDRINRQPVAVIRNGSDKIKYRYSILVKQYALSKEAHAYWQLIQKNSQQLGTLFDAQPTQLTGNIHAVANDNKPVIGFISAGSPQYKRIFINKNEVTNWVPFTMPPDCYIKTIDQNASNFRIFDYPDPSYTIYYYVTGGIVIGKKICLDCRESGGTNTKPAFW